MTVFSEIIEASAASDSGTGVSVTRGFYLTELRGPKADRVVAALNDSRVPQLGAPHPTRGHLFVISRKARMQDTRQCRVEVEYGIPKATAGQPAPGQGGGVSGPVTNTPPDPGTISVGSTASVERVIRDIDGRLLEVTGAREVTKTVTSPKGVSTKQKVIESDTQVREAEVVVPNTVLRVTRTEQGSPDRKSRKYVGTVNKKPLGVKSTQSGKRRLDKRNTWLCTRIDGTSNDGGQTYQVTYEFQYRPEDWTFSAIYIDKTTGQPLTEKRAIELGVNPKQLERLYRVYEEEDFSQLGIRFEGP